MVAERDVVVVVPYCKSTMMRGNLEVEHGEVESNIAGVESRDVGTSLMLKYMLDCLRPMAESSAISQR